jgi:hypothetical protein
MLRDEENAKYRSYLKKTVEFDPDILKRYVNFMSNPDERTAIDQFGWGDKYFGVSVLLATLPGLPMFGHGQIEGYTERYGMDFKQARLDEQQNEGMIARHQQLIAPLLKNRRIFAESTHFVLYDFWTAYGDVDENVFAYSNWHDNQRSVILYNNRYGSTHGTIKTSVAFLEKGSGSLRQKSLSDGLMLYAGDNAILAYRDTVQGLEFLRRASDLRDHGLTLELRGYQHVVLLDWRELQPTESHPWDRLCDALNGSGVYSVDEALSQLRLRPLVDTLHHAVSGANVYAFSKAAGDILAREQSVEEKSKTRPTKITSASEVDDRSHVLDPVLVDFLATAQSFAAIATSLSPPTSADNAPSTWDFPPPDQDESDSVEIKRADYASTVSATIRLPALALRFPESLQPAVRSVLPTNDNLANAALVWAPVLAWLALRALATPTASLKIYDDLRIRHILAETFSAVGIHGEDAWRAAARIRVLLMSAASDSSFTARLSQGFWRDGDVRWLTGVHATAEGFEKFDPQNFAEFVCWLQLPALIAVAEDASLHPKRANDVTAIAANLAYAAKISAYDCQRFMDFLRSEQDSRKPVSEEPKITVA